MLSIEEIKLLIEKLEKVKKEDLQELIDSNLKLLKDIELAVDANNKQVDSNKLKGFRLLLLCIKHVVYCTMRYPKKE